MNHVRERNQHSFTYKYLLYAKYVPVIELNIRNVKWSLIMSIIHLGKINKQKLNLLGERKKRR